MSYNLEKNITLDRELKDSKDYNTCLEALELLRKSGMVYEAAGNCVAMSELMQHSLRELGINSKTVECKLVAARMEKNGVKEIRYIGFDTANAQDKYFVDTHVILVTETAIPMLIDLSIGHVLSNGRTWIIEKLTGNDADTLARISIPDMTLTYSYKKLPKLLGLHQKNILERLQDEKVIKDKISAIQKIAGLLVIFTVINFALNMSLIGIKFTEITSGYFGVKE